MMKQRSVRMVGFVLAAVSVSVSAMELEYPELQVVPRASETLEQEAGRGTSWGQHFPFYLSGTATLGLGLMYRGAHTYDFLSIVPPLVGLGWLGGTALMTATYRPYRAGWDEIKSMPNNTKREKLARERAAERVLERAATMGRSLSWISFLTNAGAGGLMIALKRNTKPESTTDIIMGAGVIVGSVIPFIFPTRWQTVWSDQQEYKKRIYGSLAVNPTVTVEPGTRQWVPALKLAYRF